MAPPIPADPNSVGQQTIGSIKQEKLSLERDRLLVVLHQTGGRIRGEGGAAQPLGVKPTKRVVTIFFWRFSFP
ncbi:hypothetical protein [Spirosoma linguale]|uniref:hypothetical protein n=1 Tax=Spirosoma linguale TaxID=108 RepID=UPI000315C685